MTDYRRCEICKAEKEINQRESGVEKCSIRSISVEETFLDVCKNCRRLIETIRKNKAIQKIKDELKGEKSED